MKLASVPLGIGDWSSVGMWLRTLTASIAAGWGVEHTSTGTHGDVTATSLAATGDVSGATVTTDGVVFPATQVQSTDANTLDDYEEGTWTPALAFGGGSTGLTYSTRGGVYTKVGRVVTVTAYIALSAKGSSTGSATITGLPFTSTSGTGTNTNSGVVAYGTNFAGLTSPPTALIGSSATSIVLYDWGAAGVVNVDDTNFGNTTDFGVTVTYFSA